MESKAALGRCEVKYFLSQPSLILKKAFKNVVK